MPLRIIRGLTIRMLLANCFGTAAPSRYVLLIGYQLPAERVHP